MSEACEVCIKDWEQGACGDCKDGPSEGQMGEAFEKWFNSVYQRHQWTEEQLENMRDAFAAGQAAGRLEGYHTVAKVEFYVHQWGKEGRLPVIDYIPAELIGEEVEVIIRKRGEEP